MIKIAVCDDNSTQLDIVKEYFNIFQAKLPDETAVDYFSSGIELLDVSSNLNYDIYLLDMIMPEKNGIEVACALRERKDKGKILFLSASKDYVFEAFNVKASDYLVKPIGAEKLFEKIKQLINEIIDEQPATVTIKTKKGDIIIKVADILYIENIERAPVFFLSDGNTIESIAKRGKFSEIISEFLDKYDFCLCGVSIAVNFSHVESFKRDPGIIYLDCKKEIFCSRLFAKDFKNSLDKYRKI